MVKSGMVVGLGTGSTSSMAIEELGLLIQANKLKDVVAVATSYESKVLARQFGVKSVDLNDVNHIDVAFDGANERRRVQPSQIGGFQSRSLRCLRGILPLSVASVQVEPSSEVKASASAQDILDWNLEGWNVVLDETGEAVGRVEEVLSLASYWDPSVVEYCLLRVFDSSSPGIEYLIPWVDDVVKEVDIKAQCILIKPPDGLLELAKRPELLRKIRIELESFGLHTEGQAEPHMPTRRQLQQAGEYKLIEMIAVCTPTHVMVAIPLNKNADLLKKPVSWTGEFFDCGSGPGDTYSWPRSISQAKLRMDENFRRYIGNYVILVVIVFLIFMYQTPMALVGIIAVVVVWDTLRRAGDEWGLERDGYRYRALAFVGNSATLVLMVYCKIALALFWAGIASLFVVIVHNCLRRITPAKVVSTPAVIGSRQPVLPPLESKQVARAPVKRVKVEE